MIKFKVRGKYLTIVQIRKISRKRHLLKQRMNRRYRFIKLWKYKIKQYSRNFERTTSVEAIGDKAMLECSLLDRRSSKKIITTNAAIQNKSIQTLCTKVKPESKCCSTETKVVPLKTSAQQTIATLRYKLSGSVMKPITIIPPPVQRTVSSISTRTQTEFDTITTAVQCKFRTLSGGTQTDEISIKSSSTQVWFESVNGSNKKITQKIATNPKSFEQDAVIYMLNEIGELILNQNHILNNNTKMLSQITEMTTLSKMVSLGQSWRYWC